MALALTSVGNELFVTIQMGYQLMSDCPMLICRSSFGYLYFINSKLNLLTHLEGICTFIDGFFYAVVAKIVDFAQILLL
ncbi:hypothetical protein [Lysinibacillus xylanilyticus]|uniref:hypothetical protein n=1 Tax=Lysinibacillus xylanilyticus TaxID=582475 RepID=UPI003D02795A